VVKQGLEVGLDLLHYRQGNEAMLALINEAETTIAVDAEKNKAFLARLDCLQTQHPSCFLTEPPPCTVLDYQRWEAEAKALTVEAVTIILTACGNPKLNPEAPLWVILPNAGKVLPHFAEDETTHATLSSLLVKAGCNRVKTSHYSTPEEETLLAELILAERAKHPQLQVLIATWLPKVGSTLLSALAESGLLTTSQPKMFHWAIGGSALHATPCLSDKLTELPFFGYRPALKHAVIEGLFG
jgi:hypothetical protein